MRPFCGDFHGSISSWCQKNGIFLIGHMVKEPFLWSQTDAVGEAMRCYRNLNVPGVDILCDRVEYNTVKQAASVARQNGSKGVMSELYGVTNWTFGFEGHKGSGDWQAALGVTFRVPHLTWASMAGEAKRDYPASIGYQSPWVEEYSCIENYFARLNVVLTRGRPMTKVGVIHPIESFWLWRGPVLESFEEQDFRERAFADLTNWLLEGLIDFDFISESLLPQQSGAGYKVGACDYEAIILPNLKTIRRSTLQYLKRFSKSGGKVLIAGEAPKFVDAMVPESVIDIMPSSTIPFTRTNILRAVEGQRDLRITGNGRHSRQFLYQMRQDGENRFAFVCNTERKTGRFTVSKVTVSFKGLWGIEILDPLTGMETMIASEEASGSTNVHYRFDGCSSLLLRLSPGSPNSSIPQSLVLAEDFCRQDEVILDHVELDEPNVLLLDYAEYRLDNENWNSAEEVLRIDNIIRSRLGMPLKLKAYKQPWAISEKERVSVATLELRFRFFSEVELDAELAIENPRGISFNGQALGRHVGWWVDKAIRRVSMSGNGKGENLLLVKIPFELLTNVERFYVLGSFGVSLKGREATLVSGSALKFGDWTRQGLPFYAGSAIYHCTITKAQAIWVGFSGPLVAVSVNGIRKGVIAFEPYILELEVDPGALEIKCFENRFNAFGHLHLPEGKSPWCGPLLWRTEDDWWTPEYGVVPMGILQTPVLMSRGKLKPAFWREGPTY